MLHSPSICDASNSEQEARQAHPALFISLRTAQEIALQTGDEVRIKVIPSELLALSRIVLLAPSADAYARATKGLLGCVCVCALVHVITMCRKRRS